MLHTLKHFGTEGDESNRRQEHIVVRESFRIAHSLKVTESRRMRLAEDLACMGKVKNADIVEFLLQHVKLKKNNSGYMRG